MNIFEVSKTIHILLGLLALVGFWGVAMAAKGSTLHRRFGTAYLVVMTMLLTVTMVMAFGMVMVGAFSVLGLATSGSLLYRIIRGAEHSQWWLSEHLTAIALNFGATHSSMTILGRLVKPAVWANPSVDRG